MAVNPNVVDDYDGTYDGAYAHVLQDDERCHVSYDVDSRNGFVVVTRTVTKKAYRRRDQVILWQEICAVLPRRDAAEMLRDMALSL